MKKIQTLMTVVLFTILLSFFNIQTVSALSNFEILDLDVVIDVQEDGVYSITESYKLDFTSPGLGIYRDLKTRHTMNFTDSNGRTHRDTYYFPVTDIHVEGDEYYIEGQFNGERIVVGPDDGPRFTGPKEYVITYKVHTDSFDQEGAKEIFFYNLVSDWEETIHKFTGTVNFYKDVNIDALVVKAQEHGYDFDVVCQTNSGSSFTCATDSEFTLYEGNGITAYVPLDDDFFNRTQQGSYFFFTVLLSILAFVIAIIIKLLFGQRLPLIEKVSFKAPEGFNAPMVGAAYAYETLNIKSIYALLFEWANQGLIEIETDKKTITCTRLKDIPVQREQFEQDIFLKLFPVKDKGYTPKDWQKANVYDSLLMQMNAISLAVNKKGEIYDKKSKSMSTLSVLVSVVLFFISMFLIVSSKHFKISNSLVIAGVLTIGMALVSFVTVVSIRHHMHTNSKKKAVSTSVVSIFVFAIVAYLAPVIIRFVIGIKLDSIHFLIMSIFFGFAIIASGFTEVKTQYGSDLMGEILGLRSFIKYAKKDELIAMQNSNPSLYYDVLPYAYVFDMSDLWLDHFKDIEIPSSVYYRSYNPTFTNYMMMRSLTRSMTRIPTTIVPPNMTAGKGGGSFSSGGGFSGGGFSGGGGFGGGGGGGR